MISTLIGVGFMGKGIARNIALKGLTNPGSGASLPLLCLYDNNAQQIEQFLQSINDEMNPNSKKNIRVLEDPSQSMLIPGVVALSLPSEQVCERLLFDKDDGIVTKFASEQRKLSPGKRFIVDHGTYSRDFVLYCHDRIQKSVRADLAATVAYIDAPVSGGPQGAWNGTLSIMMGGEKENIEYVLPVLQLYSSKCVHFGSVGSGMAVKLVNQALVGMHAQAACEAIHLAEQFGLINATLSADESSNLENAQKVSQLKDLLQTSWGQSKVLDLVISDYQHCLSGENAGKVVVADVLAETKSAAPLRNMDKDFDCINRGLQQGACKGSTRLPVFEETRASISTACKDRGLAEAPFASLLKLLQSN